jgi:hypothetical protein
MMTMDISTMQLLIKPEMAVIVVLLIVLGTIFKNVKKIPDELIPICLLVIGISFACGINKSVTVDAFVQGILCTAMSVYGNQLYKQGIKALGNNSTIQ